MTQDGDPSGLDQLTARRIERPWGRMDVLVLEHSLCSIRIITIDAGRRLSLQRHTERDELFIPIDDGLKVQIGQDGDLKTVNRGKRIFVPRNSWHRLGAPPWKVRCVEIAFGRYDQNDIERLADDYGRPMIGDAEK